MTSLVAHLKDRALETLVSGMPAADRFALARRLIGEMPREDRERLIANSPNFVQFARAFLLAAGRMRPTG